MTQLAGRTFWPTWERLWFVRFLASPWSTRSTPSGSALPSWTIFGDALSLNPVSGWAKSGLLWDQLPSSVLMALSPAQPC